MMKNYVALKIIVLTLAIFLTSVALAGESLFKPIRPEDAARLARYTGCIDEAYEMSGGKIIVIVRDESPMFSVKAENMATDIFMD